MTRTTIMLPAVLKRQAETNARRRQMSLGGYIRRSLQESVKADFARKRDPLFDEHNIVIVDGGPRDLAENHDKYLEQMLLEEHDQQLREWKKGRKRTGHGKKSTK